MQYQTDSPLADAFLEAIEEADRELEAEQAEKERKASDDPVVLNPEAAQKEQEEEEEKAEELQDDLVVLASQGSPDELSNVEDVLNTEAIIDASRAEHEEEEQAKKEVIYFSIWELLKKGAINLVLPFINGMMLGFGEILAHEIGFRYKWQGARVLPARREQRELKSKYL